MSFTMRPMASEDAERVKKLYGKKVMTEFNPGKCILSLHHIEIAQQIIDAPVKNDDVWLISFPRTGSTWCQEMIWLIGNDLDFDTARNTIQQIRAPLLEMSTVLDILGEDHLGNSLQFVNDLRSPRYIKSHLPLGLLPAQLDKIKPKIVYTCRNPKDMCVSYYYYCKSFHHYQSSFEEFCDLILRGLTQAGSVLDHCLPFWKKRNESNILFLKYEDIKRDLRGTLRRIADFMEKTLTEEDYDKLCDFLSFQNMRENKGCNMESFLKQKNGKDFFESGGERFIRKGQIGDWKSHMSPELAKRFDDWIEENTRGTGLNWD